MSSFASKFQPIRSFASLYLRIFREGAMPNWKRVVYIGILDFISVFSATGTMIVIALIVSGASRGDLVELANSVLSYLQLEVSNVKYAQLTVLILGGVLSSSLILTSAFARFRASLSARKVARRYHKELYDELFALFEKLPTVPRIPSLKRGNDLNIAIIQDSIHASKALETLIRLPQVSLFALVLLIAAFKIEATAMIALLIAITLGIPIIVITGRKIQKASSAFFETNSRAFGGKVSKILNGFETYATDYPPAKVKFDEGFIFAEGEYLNTFDHVQLSSDRMNLSASVVRALGFGTAFVFIASLVVIQDEELTIVIAFATAVYLFVSQLQTLFGSLSSLVVFFPQARRLFMVRHELIDAQTAHTSALDSHQVRDASEVRLHEIRSGFEPSINPEELKLTTGSIFNVVASPLPSRFGISQLLGKVNATLTTPIRTEDVAYIRSATHDFSQVTLQELIERLDGTGRVSMTELVNGLGQSEGFSEWSENVRNRDDGGRLTSDVIRGAKGPIQGVVALAVAVIADNPHLLIDRTYITRYHGGFREFVVNLFSERYLWLMCPDDVTESAYGEALKVDVRMADAQWVPVAQKLPEIDASRLDGDDQSLSIIM